MGYIDIKKVSIQFPGVKALDEVSFTIEKGHCVALCGENGAGKSTLGKILGGVYAKGVYDGDIEYKGNTVSFKSTLDAEKAGITIVHQELNQISEMTVAENIFLSNMPNRNGVINFSELFKKAEDFLREVGLDIDSREKIKDLTVSKRQMVEIAKAISKNPEVIIFDEATSSLTENEAGILFAIIQRLKQEGKTMIYVSHKLDEIFKICDDVVVLKDGHLVDTLPIEGLTKDQIVKLMVGRELKDMYPEHTCTCTGDEIMRVSDWTVFDLKESEKIVVDNVSLCLKKGEILGIYGLIGAGRTEFVNSIFEGNDVKSKGELFINGKPVKIKSTSDSIKNGLALVTEDRKKTGLVLILSVKDNIPLASLKKFTKRLGIIDAKTEGEAVKQAVSDLKIKVPDVNHLLKQLSGGNQQKAVLSKWLLTNPQVLILDEPTRGIDVGTKAEIYRILKKLAESGISIIMVSSELPEILGVSDRVLVMRQGKFVFDSPCENLNEELLVHHAMGGAIN